MTLFRETAPDMFAPWHGEPLATTLQRPVPVLDEEGAPVRDEDDNPVTELEDYVDDVRYPASIEQLWSDAELAAIDLYRPAAAEPVPYGKIATSTEVQRVNGIVRYIHVLADAPPPTNEQVDAERDRRIEAGFEFNGVMFQARAQDQKRIAGAGTLALGAMVAGVQPGNLRWHGGSEDFAWIAADNTTMPMDAQTVFLFGQAAANWESLHVFAARA
ncbi:MAG: DUF4376 domain-containing protein [Rhizobiaceae bacterium]